jgi:hypothetical protein
MGNFADKSWIENQNTFLSENCTVYKIIWTNVADRPQMTI